MAVSSATDKGLGLLLRRYIKGQAVVQGESGEIYSPSSELRNTRKPTLAKSIWLS